MWSLENLYVIILLIFNYWFIQQFYEIKISFDNLLEFPKELSEMNLLYVMIFEYPHIHYSLYK